MGPTPDKKAAKDGPRPPETAGVVAPPVTDSDSDWESDVESASGDTAGPADNDVQYAALPADADAAQVHVQFEWQDWTEECDSAAQNADERPIANSHAASGHDANNTDEEQCASGAAVGPSVAAHFEQALAESSARHLGDTDFAAVQSAAGCNDIPLNDDKISAIKDCMAQIKLPPASVPHWAHSVPDDQWREHLEERMLNTDKRK